MSQLKYWCFTSYLDTEPYVKGYTFCYMQREICPTTGKLHWQGYIGFARTIKRKKAQEYIGDPVCHIEGRKGTHKQAKDYCMKQESRAPGCEPIFYGEEPSESEQGKRSDLQHIANEILSGKTIHKVAIENPVSFIRYGRGMRDLHAISTLETCDEWRTIEVIVLYGAAGSGKTRFAVANEDYYILNEPAGQNLWFDGYNGESTLIIDDFKGWIKHAVLLKILDGYKLRLDIKQTHGWAQWKKIYITSNFAPDHWYSLSHPWDSDMALQRRITKIFKCTPNIFGYQFQQVNGNELLDFNKDFEMVNQDQPIEEAHRDFSFLQQLDMADSIIQNDDWNFSL